MLPLFIPSFIRFRRRTSTAGQGLLQWFRAHSATCIQRILATLLMLAVHLVEGLSTPRFPVDAIPAHWLPNVHRSYQLSGPLIATSASRYDISWAISVTLVHLRISSFLIWSLRENPSIAGLCCSSIFLIFVQYTVASLYLYRSYNMCTCIFCRYVTQISESALGNNSALKGTCSILMRKLHLQPYPVWTSCTSYACVSLEYLPCYTWLTLERSRRYFSRKMSMVGT